MAFMLRWASVSSGVQLWPAGGTYCRSSSQIGHDEGGFSLGAYCVPHVVQMKAGMISYLPLKTGLRFSANARCASLVSSLAASATVCDCSKR